MSQIKSLLVPTLVAGIVGGTIGGLLVHLLQEPSVRLVSTEEGLVTIPTNLSQCADVLKNNCAGITPGAGRLKSCLLKHKEELGSDCLKQIEKLKVPSGEAK